MKDFRLNRLFNALSRRCFDVAVDHAVTEAIWAQVISGGGGWFSERLIADPGGS